MIASVSLQVREGVDGVLQRVHVVPIDVPVAEVADGVVLYVANVFGHDATGDVLVAAVHADVALQHRHLQLAEDLIGVRDS